MITNDDRTVHVSHDTLRLGIGVLGITLPLLLFLGTWFLEKSISNYYYSTMRDYLEGVLFFLAFFLAAYRPYGESGKWDNRATNAAALFALFLALFPTNAPLVMPTHVPPLPYVAENIILRFVSPEWSGLLHNIGSGGLFVSFAILSAVLFTQSGGKGWKGWVAGWKGKKGLRNAIYLGCGVGIAVCIGTIGWQAFWAANEAVRQNLDVFWPEAIALVLFGFSWLVKGGAFPMLND